MGKDWCCLVLVIFTLAACFTGQQEPNESSSLVKLLSKGPKRSKFSQRQDTDIVDDTVEEVPISLPEKLNIEHHHFIPVEPNSNFIRTRATLFTEPYEKAKKRERFEASILGNPRPTKTLFNGGLSMNKQSFEMQKGDFQNSIPSEIESHTNQQDENLKHVLEIASNINRDDTLIKSTGMLPVTKEAHVDKQTHLKDVDIYENYHKLEPEFSDELVVDEQLSNNKIPLKLKRKNKFIRKDDEPYDRNSFSAQEDSLYYRQPEAEMFKSSKSDFIVTHEQKKANQKKQARPKYKMRRIDTDRSSEDEIVNSQRLNDNDSEVIINSSEQLLQVKDLSDSSDSESTNATSRRHADKLPVPQVLPETNKAFFSFSYDKESPFGPQAWQLLNVDWTCTARKQSPIDIDTKYLIDNLAVKNIVVKVSPPNAPLVGTLRNNGHAPTLSISNEISVKLFGGNLANDYYFKQLHFHFGCTSVTGSEHQINGVAFPLEVHLVFWDNSTYKSFPDAAKADRGIAVLAVLFEVQPNSNQTADTPLSQVIQLLRHIEEEDDSVAVKEEFNFRLENLVPNVMKLHSADRFYTYEGSLSTPGCYESVTWIVMATYLPVTESELSIFRKLRSSKVNHYSDEMCNNYRPVQRKNGRRIYSNII